MAIKNKFIFKFLKAKFITTAQKAIIKPLLQIA